MPARVKQAGNLAGLIGSDSEQDLDSIISATNTVMQPVKKPRGRPPSAARQTKPAPRRLSGGVTKPKSTPVLSQSSKNKTNKSNVMEDEDSGKDIKPRRGRPSKQAVDSSTLGALVPSEVGGPKRGRPPGKPKKPAAQEILEADEPEESEDQGDEEEEGGEDEEEDEEEEEHEEEHIADDMELDENDIREEVSEPIQDLDVSSSMLRRRLGELTRKYASLESRHRQLQEVGVKEAEGNYERLRKQNEDSTAASNKLIAQLKEEVAAQKALVQQGKQLKVQLDKSEMQARSLEAKVDQLTKSLSEARSEIKTLSTKLSASRNAEATAKVPGSALKSNAPASRAAAAQQTEAVQFAQLKEDLYGDLTGLIIRGLKREPEEDVFDCIQTGRNGTLHFKLALENPDAAENYQDIQFTYRPQLDDDRDADLIEMLPDYLIEEITFPRPQAAKFYNKVSKSLVERPQ